MSSCAFLLRALLAAAPSENESALVRDAERRWAQATIKADTTALETLLSADLTYVHSSGRMESKPEFIQSRLTGSPKYISIDYDDIKVRVYGAAAVLTSNPKMTLVNQGQTTSFQVRLTHVWIKQQGRWQLVAHQTTRLPEPPKP